MLGLALGKDLMEGGPIEANILRGSIMKVDVGPASRVESMTSSSRNTMRMS